MLDGKQKCVIHDRHELIKICYSWAIRIALKETNLLTRVMYIHNNIASKTNSLRSTPCLLDEQQMFISVGMRVAEKNFSITAVLIGNIYKLP